MLGSRHTYNIKWLLYRFNSLQLLPAPPPPTSLIGLITRYMKGTNNEPTSYTSNIAVKIPKLDTRPSFKYHNKFLYFPFLLHMINIYDGKSALLSNT